VILEALHEIANRMRKRHQRLAKVHLDKAEWWNEARQWLTALPWRRSNRGTDNGSGERGRD